MRITGTILTRIVLMCSTLSVVLLNTHYLGTEGQGTASLITLGIMLVLALSQFIGGGAMVYLVPRMAPGKTLLPAAIWAGASAVIWVIVFQFIPLVPQEYIVHACAIGLIQSLYMILQQITLAGERIRLFNGIMAVQAVIVAVCLGAFFFLMEWRHIHAFITALYASSLFALLGYTIANRTSVRAALSAWDITAWKELFRLGKFAQGGNILHLLNQRLNVVFLEHLWHTGRSAVGVMSIALYFAEAIWTVSKSLSVIQYARIANMADDSDQRRLTGHYMKVSLAAVAAGSLALWLVPESWLLVLFTDRADELKPALLWLIPGILANGASIIYAHYFSGRGLHRENMIASGLGLLLSAGAAIILIPSLGIRGASISTSLAFVTQCAWFAVRYRSKAGVKTASPGH
jgi:O-antigen/teichoic acid export membrane protein